MVVKGALGYSGAHCAAVNHFRLAKIKGLWERVPREETIDRCLNNWEQIQVPDEVVKYIKTKKTKSYKRQSLTPGEGGIELENKSNHSIR